MSGEDDEDYAALIYRESQLRKAEAAAATAAAKDAEKKRHPLQQLDVVQQLQLGQHPLLL